MDTWVYRLKDAYDAGYYKTEPAVEAQTPFPWQNKTCKDCPFWANGVCHVFTEHRNSMAHTCVYFDAENRGEAETMIHHRQSRAFQQWWQGFNDRGATR